MILTGIVLQPSSNMLNYQLHLKKKYNLLALSSSDEILKCRSSCYVNLQLTKHYKQELLCGQVDGILRNKSKSDKESLTLADMLNVKGEQKKVILIEGGPGMGKSTLAIEICKCWANGELLQEYNAVILLALRDPEIQAATNISDLLLVENKKQRELLYDEITASEGEKVCFIFEGYDELPNKLRRSPVFAKLIEKLPMCTLVYTSRPEACEKLRDIVVRRIEIQGFQEKQIEEYIDHAFIDVEGGKKKASDLKSQVNNNPLIKSMLYAPINVAIVCHLFLLTLALPSTLTQLYTLLCLNLVLRHINKTNADEIDFLDSLYHLPLPSKDEFYKLCYIAFKGRENSKIIFSSCELRTYGIDVRTVSGMGLLIIAPSTSVYGREKSYNFLHLTLQEFCAAFYISTLPPQEQYECFEKYQFKEDFQIVWRFYSGITGLVNKKILHDMLPCKWILHYDERKLVELLYYLYEVHNDKVCQLVGDHLEGSIDVSGTKNLETTTLCYFLEKYKGVLKAVNVSGCDIGDEGCCAIVDTLLLHHTNVHLPQLNLNLSYNRTTDKTSAMVGKLALSNCAVYNLNCGGCFHTFNYISRSFNSFNQNTFIKELLITDSCLVPFDIWLLAQMLIINSTIKVLNISLNFGIGPTGCQYLAECRNLSLNKIIMYMCNIGDTGPGLIGEMLYHNKSIAHIELGQNEIGDDGVKRLVKHLNSHKVIDYLDLQDNRITAVGAHYIKWLFANTHLVLNSLELSCNYQLKDDGVDTILRSPNNAAEYVGLKETQATSFSFASLSKVKSVKLSLPDKFNDICALADISTLKHLELCDGSDAAYHKVISNINTSGINKLVFCKGHFSQSTVLALIEALKQNGIIMSLEINRVKVAHSDLLLLADMLAVNTVIKQINIIPHYDDLFEQSTALKILQRLKQNYILEVITLGIRASYDRNTEIVVEELNEIRQHHGVATPLLVKLDIFG